MLKQLLFSACISLACFALPATVFSASTQQPPDAAISLRQIEQDRTRLLNHTRQLINTVLEEMRLEAIRKSNGLRNKIYNLESQYSESLFLEIQDEAQWVAMAFGTDVNSMAGYYRLAKLIIGKVEPTQTLRESYGIQYSSKVKRQEDVEAFRRGLRDNVAVSYLRHLIKEPPEKALKGFRQYTEALRKLQIAEQFKAEAEVMEIAANQELMRDLASGVPLLSDAVDIVGVVTGENAFTGEQLSGMQRTFDGLLVLVPNALEIYFTKSPQFAEGAKKFIARIDAADSASLNKMASAMGRSVHDIGALQKKLKKTLAAAEHKSKKVMGDMLEKLHSSRLTKQQQKLDDELDNIFDFLVKTDEIDPSSVRLWEAAERQGKARVEQLDDVFKASAGQADDLALLEAYQSVRQDKRALTQLQGDQYLELRKQIQNVENNLFSHVDGAGALTVGKVDVDAIADIKSGLRRPINLNDIARIKAKAVDSRTADEILRLKTAQARERIISAVRNHGNKSGAGPASGYLDEALDFDNMEITVFNATNKPPAPGKVGFDRDITYQVVIPERSMMVRNPRTGAIERVTVPAQKIDVPAELVEEHYHTSLYRNLNPGKPLPSRRDILAFGSRMDHQVTDAFHKDAYHLDLENVTDYFKDPTLLSGQGARVEDFSSTVSYKSEHWFDLAEKTRSGGNAMGAMAETAEGMRQASKQYENYMTKIVAYNGLNAVDHLPVKLQKGMHIFRRVGEGKLSVPQAEAALKHMGLTKAEVVELFGQQFESIVKLARKKELLKEAAKTAVRGGETLSDLRQGDADE
ncbi:hypothetical protein F3F96_04680 [Mariprofundus sp. NF]|uniref:pre-toxin TG domain-containing protein n=1 Tax=Mariprofundus sp. NF TaxID=2608716 RepID=UPI0015A2823F|nr:pre-toxin TG domain-containing protein [Mariprofundus sp. NF]NWF38423.1 hypothetical protein [Mariprofundus sp. NF]